MEKLLYELKEKYNLVMVCRFGSHLYGADTPASDLDLKGIFMPKREEILLNKIQKSVNFDSNKSDSKNTAEDVDIELYSFHYFMELAMKGEMIGLDMLHASGENILISSPTWKSIRAKRSLFYTTNMKGFVKYAKKQAAKYGEKGSRLESVDKLVTYLNLNTFDSDARMDTVWNNLPTDEHMRHRKNSNPKIKEFLFCGKVIQSTAKVSYVLEMLETFKNSYGHRARKAKENGGVDWKAISHALRACIQIERILREGDLTFPLPEGPFIRDVKEGNKSIEGVLEVLEDKLAAIDALTEISDFPKEVNREYIESIMLTELETIHGF
jgi:predicted nucleotidyltransferase